MTDTAHAAATPKNRPSAAGLNPELLSERERERLAAREAQQLRELQHIQLRQVKQQLPRFLIITALSVLAAAWLFWDWPYASNNAILIWAGSFLLFLMARGLVVWWYGRRVAQNLNTLGTNPFHHCLQISSSQIAFSIWKSQPQSKYALF